jgi:hypothetical protein
MSVREINEQLLDAESSIAEALDAFLDVFGQGVVGCSRYVCHAKIDISFKRPRLVWPLRFLGPKRRSEPVLNPSYSKLGTEQLKSKP